MTVNILFKKCTIFTFTYNKKPECVQMTDAKGVRLLDAQIIHIKT